MRRGTEQLCTIGDVGIACGSAAAFAAAARCCAAVSAFTLFISAALALAGALLLRPFRFRLDLLVAPLLHLG